MKLLGKNNRPITGFEDWKEFAPPKAAHHWAAGRSAREFASLWCRQGKPSMPVVLREVFESMEGAREIEFEVGRPEHRIRFDNRRGEPRNADMAFVYRAGVVRVAVTIEAKADESFGQTVAQTFAAAAKRAALNDRSGGIDRVHDLIAALFSPRTAKNSEISGLRYQLLTAVAGTIAYAKTEGASKAVLVVHEFKTTATEDGLHTRNANDLDRFLNSLASKRATEPTMAAVWGSFKISGAPLFADVPPLYIAKAVTDCRAVSWLRPAPGSHNIKAALPAE
jgi:hypothetical protein